MKIGVPTYCRALLGQTRPTYLPIWEGPIRRARAAALCCAAPSLSGSDVLNIGFGMGLFDEAAQALGPRSHTIVEAHPDVWANMHARGWASRPRCALVFGRWQEALCQKLAGTRIWVSGRRGVPSFITCACLGSGSYPDRGSVGTGWPLPDR